MPAAWPAALPETFLDKQPFARSPLVKHQPGRRVPLHGPTQRIGRAAVIALGAQQLGAHLGHRGGPGARGPAAGALLGPLEELTGSLELAGTGADAGRGDVVARRAEGHTQRGSNSASAWSISASASASSSGTR